MKVLFVFSGNSTKVHPFISEQRLSLEKKGVQIDYFPIIGKGLTGYLKNLPNLNKIIKINSYDLVHAHYGFSGMLAVLQTKCPVIISFIGEMNFPILRIISRIALRFSAYNIFVSEELKIKSKIKKNNYSIIPYGVDLDTFVLLDKVESRKKLKLPLNRRVALFSGLFDNPDKNYQLAKDSVNLVDGLILFELSGHYKRNEVNLLFNACDLLLLTSPREGSPQVIKEAMACNCPIVSTDVGDVKEIIGNTKGCYVTSFDPLDVAEKIKLALKFGRKTNGRQKIKHLDVNIIAKNIIDIYNSVLA
jgi:glycosyltransferase involved in cell wall biosynthesis